jgi:hypothetical protein
VILGKLKTGVGWHFVFEGCLIFRIIAEEYVLIDVENTVLDIFLTESGEQLTIQVIGNSTAVQDLA